MNNIDKRFLLQNITWKILNYLKFALYLIPLMTIISSADIILHNKQFFRLPIFNMLRNEVRLISTNKRCTRKSSSFHALKNFLPHHYSFYCSLLLFWWLRSKRIRTTQFKCLSNCQAQFFFVFAFLSHPNKIHFLFIIQRDLESE